MKWLTKYKFELLLLALVIHLMYPFFSLLIVAEQDFFRLFSFTFLVAISLVMSKRAIPKLSIIISGGISTFGLWCNYLLGDHDLIQYLRIYTTCFFYIVLTYTLTRNFLDAKSINLQAVIGAMSGYLLIGFIGASAIEMMNFHYPDSFKLPVGHESYDYYYFSFISLITVGYGDIVPVSSPAKSLSILISIIGQFYMAIGLASFVGKFISK